MTARAEGFWWVRMRGPGRAGEDGCPWEVAHLYGMLRRTGGNDLRETEECIEWGPYLGKEPNSIIGLDSLLDHHAEAHDLPMVTIGGFMVARVSEDTPHTIKGEKLDQTRADIRSALESAGVLPAVEETPEPVDPWPRRNSDENRKLYGAPDGWDLVWWKSIKPGDVVRYRAGPHFSGDRERVHEGTVERVDVSGPTISIVGISGFNPTVNPSGWLRRTEETPTP